MSKSKVTPYRTSSALTKATTKAKRNNNKTGEGFLIWEMSNKNCIMIIVLLLTFVVTDVEMIMDLFASFPFNVDCKEVYAKANCAEINFKVCEILSIGKNGLLELRIFAQLTSSDKGLALETSGCQSIFSVTIFFVNPVYVSKLLWSYCLAYKSPHFL